MSGNEYRHRGQTVAGVLNVISNHTHWPENEPVTSCHARVGRVIGRHEEILPTDEVVLLGPGDGSDRITHSIITRDGDVIYDMMRKKDDPNPPTYDGKTGEYDTKAFFDGEKTAIFQTVLTLSVQDLIDRYEISTAFDQSLQDHDNTDTPEP